MNKIISILLLVLITGGGNLFAQDIKVQSDNTIIADNIKTADKIIVENKMSMDKKDMIMPDMSTWPELQRNAAEEIIRYYGKPDSITWYGLIWMNKGDWEKICVRIPVMKKVVNPALH